ncbi:DUF1648 domain-containing protein [Sporofaciens sp. JLR.KK001]|uniref:DUF1648 domain-containing protein n=1 Tax=Sporofaciens sp. JLR.KK001 TaxID=3112621 RepID=UPI002FF2B58A
MAVPACYSVFTAVQGTYINCCFPRFDWDNVCCFLPDSIPIHFNAQGEADLFVNKWFLLLGTVIPYSVYFQFLRHGGKGNK